MVNSTWTEEHINELWQRPLSTHRVYPPCGVDDLKSIPRPCTEHGPNDLIKIISIGQFRPEKNHPLQLRAMYELRQLIPESVWDRVSGITSVPDCPERCRIYVHKPLICRFGSCSSAPAGTTRTRTG